MRKATDLTSVIVLRVTPAELGQVKQAAYRHRVSLAEYVRRAVNGSLRAHGVDAVLLREDVKMGRRPGAN